MQDSSAGTINYINSSLYKCILKTAMYTDTDTFTCTRSLYPARKCYAHLLRRKGSGGRVTSFSASFPREVSIVRSYSDGRPRRLTVAFGYFTSLLHRRLCAWAWKMRLIGYAGVTKGACVTARGVIAGQLPNCGASSEILRPFVRRVAIRCIALRGVLKRPLFAWNGTISPSEDSPSTWIFRSTDNYDAA